MKVTHNINTVMHSHVRGSHCAKFDDDDFNCFRIAGMLRDRHRYFGHVRLKSLRQTKKFKTDKAKVSVCVLNFFVCLKLLSLCPLWFINKSLQRKYISTWLFCVCVCMCVWMCVWSCLRVRLTAINLITYLETCILRMLVCSAFMCYPYQIYISMHSASVCACARNWVGELTSWESLFIFDKTGVNQPAGRRNLSKLTAGRQNGYKSVTITHMNVIGGTLNSMKQTTHEHGQSFQKELTRYHTKKNPRRMIVS